MADSNNRHVFINQIEVAVVWQVYSNENIQTVGHSRFVAAQYNGAVPIRARLSNLFLDYTYRDLSIESNRRLFITEDGKPA